MRLIHFIRYLLFLCATLQLLSCSESTPKLKPLHLGDVIVAFGDSLTFGTGATKETNYPYYLEKITGIQVINEGMPGEETTGGLARIHTVLKKHQPKLVILCLGGNDQLRKRNPSQIKKNLGDIIQIIRNTGADVVLIAAPRLSLGLAVPEYYQELGESFRIPVDENILAELLGTPELKSDYIHLNAKGYEKLANSIAHLLQKAGALQP